MRLTKEQKQNRQELEKISKELDKKRGKDKIRWHNGGFDKYRVFVLFGGTEVSEGGFLCDRRWMTAKEMKQAESRWVKHSYNTRADTYLKKKFSIEVDLEKLREIDREYDLTAGCAQCGGCRFFAALDADYGICCNGESLNDGRVTLEHGGCIQHSFIQHLLAKE